MNTKDFLQYNNFNESTMETRHIDYFKCFKDISPRQYNDLINLSLPRLYTEYLFSVRGVFSRNELLFVLECFHGHLPIELGLTSDVIDEEIEDKDWDTKWGVDKNVVIGKINSLDYFQSKSLEIWTVLFWKQFDEIDESAALYINDLL